MNVYVGYSYIYIYIYMNMILDNIIELTKYSNPFITLGSKNHKVLIA